MWIGHIESIIYDAMKAKAAITAVYVSTQKKSRFIIGFLRNSPCA
jgi:hypothetical protein